MTVGVVLSKRATLSSPFQDRDQDGQIIQRYEPQGTVWANVKHLRGGETVMASRLESKSPAILTVRASSLTRRVTSEWRIEIDGRSYEAKEDPRETTQRGFFELLMEARA